MKYSKVLLVTRFQRIYFSNEIILYHSPFFKNTSTSKFNLRETSKILKILTFSRSEAGFRRNYREQSGTAIVLIIEFLFSATRVSENLCSYSLDTKVVVLIFMKSSLKISTFRSYFILPRPSTPRWMVLWNSASRIGGSNTLKKFFKMGFLKYNLPRLLQNYHAILIGCI